MKPKVVLITLLLTIVAALSSCASNTEKETPNILEKRKNVPSPYIEKPDK